MAQTQHSMMADWMSRQDQYLSILLEQEAYPRSSDLCTCGSLQAASYMCISCHGNIPYCAECTVRQHQFNPLHRIKKWNGFYFEDISLADLGLVTYLGHSGEACTHSTTPTPLLVVHTDGFHRISTSFCECPFATTFDLQLFHSRLFSATVYSPKTVFTFEVMEQYRIHHLEGKVSAYSYTQSLYRLTDDEGSEEIPVCRFLCMKIFTDSLIGSRSWV